MNYHPALELPGLAGDPFPRPSKDRQYAIPVSDHGTVAL